MTKNQLSTEVITHDRNTKITYYLLEKDLKRLLQKKKTTPIHCQDKKRKVKGVFLLSTWANF